MRKLLLAFAALLFAASGRAAYFQAQTYYIPPVPQITCNIVTGVASVNSPCVSPAANCNGSADTAAAFMAFNTWARTNQGGNQVVLTIPNGSTCFFNSSQTSPFGLTANSWAAGINNLIVEGAGATITSVGGVSFNLGANGINCNRGLTDVNGCSARIQTVSASSSSVMLTSASFSAGYLSRFSVNKWIMIGGLNVQAQFLNPTGNPVNQHYFERRQIIAINAGTGEITLDRPLTNSYSADWPSFAPGSAFEQDQGGPATIYLLNDGWNATVEYRGLTISQTGPTYAGVRNATFRDVTFTGVDGGIPSQNDTWTYVNTSSTSATMEMDKLIGTFTHDGGTIFKIDVQSSSIDRMIIRNTTFTNGLTGNAKYTEISDSSLGAWAPGTYAYGGLALTDATICTRCTITTLNMGLPEDGGNYTKSGGVITMPFGAAQGSAPNERIFIPGALLYYVTANTNPPIAFACCDSIGSFQVGTITSDPWPATDNQTLTTTINITSGTKNLNVPSGPFVSGDVGKTIVIGGLGASGRTWITGFTSATDVTVFNAAGGTIAGSQTIQWGTSNMYIQTNQSGGFPNVSALNNAGLITLKSLTTPNFTCDVCNAGNPSSDGYSVSVQAGATTGAPLGAYASKQYTPTSAQGSLGAVLGRGIFKGMSINVTVAATSAGAVTFSPVGQFGTNGLISQNTPGSPAPVSWSSGNFSINLKQTGNRAISASGVVTCNGSPGACSGDTITPPANMSTMWVQNGTFNPYMGSTHTGAPTFTITLQTDPIQ